MPHCFWLDTVICAAYVLNRCPTRALHTCAPFQARHGQNPFVDHLHVFGYLEHALVPEKQHKKLDDSCKMHFGGYIFETNGYHLYHPETRRTLISDDVLWKMQFSPAFTY